MYLTIKVDKQFKYELKGQAAKEMTTMQDLIIKALKDYCRKRDEDDLEFEELDEEDLRDIEQGRKEYEAGEYKTLEQVKEEYKCQ